MANSNQLSIPNIIAAAQNANPGNPMAAAVAATQAIVESGLTGGRGGSALAREANNLWGIKAKPGQASVNMQTHEVVNGQTVTVNADFRKFDSLEEGFREHGALLNRRYSGVNTAQNFEEAARALKQGGYATDPNYAATLSQVFHKYVEPVTGAVTALTNTPEGAMPAVIRDLTSNPSRHAIGEQMQTLMQQGKLSEAQQLSRQTIVDIFKEKGVRNDTLNIILGSRFGGDTAADVLKPENASKKLSELAHGAGLDEASFQNFVKEARAAGVQIPEDRKMENTTAAELQGYSNQFAAKTMVSRVPQLAENAEGDTPEQRRRNAEEQTSNMMHSMLMDRDGKINMMGLFLIAIIAMMGGDVSQLMGGQSQSTQTASASPSPENTPPSSAPAPSTAPATATTPAGPVTTASPVASAASPASTAEPSSSAVATSPSTVPTAQPTTDNVAQGTVPNFQHLDLAGLGHRFREGLVTIAPAIPIIGVPLAGMLAERGVSGGSPTASVEGAPPSTPSVGKQSSLIRPSGSQIG